MAQSWSLLGHYDRTARNSVFGMAFAVFVAAETFGAHEYRYKVLMSCLVLASGAFLGYKAFGARSILGLLTSALSLLWAVPFFDEKFFYSLDLTFMAAHSALAMAVSVGAFTYLKN